jgi:chromosomal replication initiation ATPase DnaA
LCPLCTLVGAGCVVSAIRCPHCHGPLAITAGSETPTLRAVERRAQGEPLWPIVMAACEAFGANVSALLTGSRMTHVHLARAVAAHVLREDHSLSYPEIGRLLETDHSVAMEACKRFKRLRTVDSRLDLAAARVRAAWSERNTGAAAE